MQCRHFTIRLSPQHLVEDEDRLNTFLRQVQVHSIQTSLVAPTGERWSVLVFFEQLPAALPARTRGRDEASPAEERPAGVELSAVQRQIYERLLEWRRSRAQEDGVPPYVIAHNAVLAQIARGHMSLSAVEDLAPIKRFGAQKAARYGADILRILHPTSSAQGDLFEDDFAR